MYNDDRKFGLPWGGEREMQKMSEKMEVSALRFAVPVVIENTATTLIGMVFSMIIGGISPSALAAVGTGNQIVTLLTTTLAMLTMGSAVLVSRYVGARDEVRTSMAVEQSILMTIALSGLVTLLVIVFARPILTLLLPGAEAQLFAETTVYLRSLMLSFPFLMLYNVLVGILRAAGNSRASMYAAIGMNLVQLVCAWIFLKVLKMDMLGAGLAYVICRLFGAMVILSVALRGCSQFHVHLANVFRPNMGMWRTVMRVGLPMTMEQVSIQGGYMLANTMCVGLGTRAASAYQIVNTLNNFAGLPQSICGAVMMTVVGQHIGARRRDKAKRSSVQISMTCLGLCMALGLVVALFGQPLSMLYTDDASLAKTCSNLLWMMLVYQLTGSLINTNDPALKVGGNQRYVMLYNVLGVWAVRLPLSWLLGYVLDMGIYGIYAANLISLVVRAGCGVIIRYRTNWIHDEL